MRYEVSHDRFGIGSDSHWSVVTQLLPLKKLLNRLAETGGAEELPPSTSFCALSFLLWLHKFVRQIQLLALRTPTYVWPSSHLNYIFVFVVVLTRFLGATLLAEATPTYARVRLFE